MRSYVSKVATTIELPSRDTRKAALDDAGYNVFNLDAADVFVDLLTDSGTGTMSDAQWGAMFEGDEAYAGSESFARFQTAVSEVMGFEKVVPVHQGRGAENVLYGALVEEGDHVINNTHFDTTRAHVANAGGVAVDCPVPEARDLDSDAPFKGNFDLGAARSHVDEVGAENVPVVVLTITNNSAAGQPVSIENTRAVAAFAEEIDATFVVDACRFAENAYFVRERESEFADWSVADIAREQLRYADAIVMSGKKDALTNIGGFVGVRDQDLFEVAKQRAILYEGFPTYGGLAGRDLDAMAVGLREAVEYDYLDHRIGQVRELATKLSEAGLPVFEPVGGHAVYVDAGELLPQIPDAEFPGQALVCELYREGGVRAVELGSFAFHGTDRPEFVRMAVPRRTYHREHFDHVAETAAAVADRREELRGYEIVGEPAMPELRHFSAALRPVE
ncbi:tryptophanase [Haloarculaceae archaeon H-GB2-1]|nr:tryptophanase [Haloarculaceae archaeon H-GB1-1]MEA5388754.1 tryptophanase [Haloarculaceae archaeon H-GB11]MEA5406810.1 tryptophanase [Haloarculaceae archaeon H-GB2-1]